MTRPLTRFAAMLAIASTAVFASACSSPAPEAESQPTKTAAADPSEAPAAEPEPSTQPDTASADEPTCETIISARTAADFASLGWSTLADVFLVGNVELPGGLQCVWGDFASTPDQVQVFGWAPITDAQATTAESDLLANGWTREEGAEGVYMTADPTGGPVDDEGYGPTYLFGDGWITYADTKQGLVLVSWPQP